MEENLFQPRRLEDRPTKKDLLEEKRSKELLVKNVNYTKESKYMVSHNIEEINAVAEILKTEGFITEIHVGLPNEKVIIPSSGGQIFMSDLPIHILTIK